MTITKEGTLASFYTVNKAPIKHLRVYFSPKQAGSGTASPENVREIEGRSDIHTDYTGQNLLPSGTFNITRRGIDYQYNTDGSIRIQGYDASYTFLSLPSNYQFYIPAGTYTLSCNTSSGITVYMLLDGNDIEFKIGNGKTSITKTIPSGIAKLQVAAYTTVDTTIYPQLEVGSTASDFKKPMIHRPQTIQFPSQTKNLFNPKWDMLNYASTYTINSDGSITQKQSDGRGWTQSNFPPVHLEAGTYTLTCSDGNTFNVGTSIDNFATQTRLPNGGGTFTLAQDADVRIKHSAPSYPTTFTVQLETGSSATNYEPYMDTIYGGYVDLITGEIYRTHFLFSRAIADMNNAEAYPGWKNCAEFVQMSGYVDKTDSGYKYNLIGNICSSIYYNSKANTTPIVFLFNDIKHDMTQTEWKATYPDLVLQFALPLATPQLVTTLAPLELQTFVGRNNIWSNADRVEVEYDLAESNDELYRRRNILLQGAPHIESATGAIANFSTDIAAPLKECKVYFEPIQEGSGDASLENMREINGWNSVNIQSSNKNMLNPAYYTKGSSYTLNGTTYTYDGNGTVTLNGKSNGESSQVTFFWTQPFDCDYYFCGNCSFDTSVGDVYMWDITTSARPTKWDGTTKSGASYPSSNLQQVKLLAGHQVQLCVRVYSVSTIQLTNATAQPMLLPKTCTDTTFEPYNGTTIPITFPRTGKNLLNTTQVWDEALTENRWIIEQGKITCSSIGDGNSTRIWFTQTFQPGTYTISTKYTGSGISGTRLICNKEFPDGTWNNSYKGWWKNIGQKLTFTLTEPSNIGLVYLSVSGHYNEEGTIYNIQLDSGEQQNAFQPYTETLYGGYIDIINGEIVVTSQHLIIDGTNGAASIANYGNNFYNGTLGTNRGLMLPNYYRTPINNGTTGIYCNKLKPSTTTQGIWGTPNEHIWEYQIYNHYQLHVVFDNATVGITEDMDWTPRTQAITAWLKENPLTFILPLETPLHYPLTPQTFKTLKGTNNIWSSANGPVSIKYWTH